ncbi:hypothetical protein HRbin26_01123 [bacterium HR26]|nr:hypothetical protein HRbin26_01123 [bacterium HR26]
MRPWRYRREQTSPDRPGRGSPRLHPLAPWHTPGLRWLARGVDILGLPVELGPPVHRTALIGLLVRRQSSRLFATRDREAGTSLIQVIHEPGPDHWLITRFIAAAGSAVADPVAYWQAILEEIVRLAGSYGIKRLHALLPPAGPVNEAFQRAGFQPFRPLTLMLADGRPPSSPERERVRVQSSHDAWSVMRLYERVTPRPVLYAESRTRASWQPGRRAGWRVTGFLVRDDEQSMAYCQVRSRHARHLLEVMADPHAMGLVPCLVATALEHVGVREGDRVWALVPDDVPGLRGQLESLGFQAVESRVWAARYTAQRVRARAAKKARALRDLQEAVAAGVPVYSQMRREAQPLVEVTTD